MKLADQQIIRRLGEIYDAQAAGGAASFASLTGSPSDNAALDSALDAKPTAELDTDGTLAANSDAKVASQKAVKTYVDARSYTAPYLVYTALLTQSGGDAPVATVLQNTLGGTVVWSYTDIGKYDATLAGAFTAGAVLIHDKITVDSTLSGTRYYASFIATTDFARLIVGTAPETLADGQLSGFLFEIRVYP